MVLSGWLAWPWGSQVSAFMHLVSLSGDWKAKFILAHFPSLRFRASLHDFFQPGLDILWSFRFQDQGCSCRPLYKLSVAPAWHHPCHIPSVKTIAGQPSVQGRRKRAFLLTERVSGMCCYPEPPPPPRSSPQTAGACHGSAHVCVCGRVRRHCILIFFLCTMGHTSRLNFLLLCFIGLLYS